MAQIVPESQCRWDHAVSWSTYQQLEHSCSEHERGRGGKVHWEAAPSPSQEESSLRGKTSQAHQPQKQQLWGAGWENLPPEPLPVRGDKVASRVGVGGHPYLEEVSLSVTLLTPCQQSK